jgi:Ni,Fe-hydrogenase III large subunit
MKSFKTQNGQPFWIDEIGFVKHDLFLQSLSEGLNTGFRMIGIFPVDDRAPEKIVALLAEPDTSFIHIIGGKFPSDKMEFESLSAAHPQVNYFECELAENYGYRPVNHPWLRPVRAQDRITGDTPYHPYRLDGNEAHEVAVGPIHAGVIEPGHFRFQCHGEVVHHLEIILGYQHRGIEKLMAGEVSHRKIPLAESITGDTCVGHVYAHCAAVESLMDTQIGLRAQVIRSVAEELERIAMHLAGLGGIANDIGLAIAASSYGRLRTLAINSLAALCGSRFGRGLFVYGGVRFDFDDTIIATIRANLNTIAHDVAEINDFMFSTTGALIRFERTGVVPRDIAEKIGMVGIAARANGLELDTRTNRPYGAYRYSPVSLMTIHTGDVFARARLRATEMSESLRFIFEQIDNIPGGKILSASDIPATLSGVVSIVEGWRGEIVHTVFTDKQGNISQYKIKDPSFNNWYGLSMALRGTAISDFPLCNKSFDLSYAGHDL